MEDPDMGGAFSGLSEMFREPYKKEEKEEEIVPEEKGELEFSDVTFDLVKFKDRVENQVTCPICYTIEDELYQLVPCLHSYCKACIRDSFESKRLKECPMCRKPFTRWEKSHVLCGINDLLKSNKPKVDTNVLLVASDGSHFVFNLGEIIRNKKLLFYLRKSSKKTTLKEVIQENDGTVSTNLSPLLLQSFLEEKPKEQKIERGTSEILEILELLKDLNIGMKELKSTTNESKSVSSLTYDMCIKTRDSIEKKVDWLGTRISDSTPSYEHNFVAHPKVNNQAMRFARRLAD